MTAIAPLPELAVLRGSHAIAYFGLLDEQAPPIVYEHLRRIGRVPRLDLVLATQGGSPAAARRLALLLHEYTDELTVLIAHRARSAGTLLALGAHRLVLGPLAELGPLDAQVGSVGDGPAKLSSEDIRAFRRMAEDWFGTGENDRLQVLALLAQRVFPPSLGTFYRADRLVRDMAHELLAYQVADAEARAPIVDRLVSGYDAHDYAITRGQARELGLRVSHPDPAEEALIWEVTSACRDWTSRAGEQVVSLLVGESLLAHRVVDESCWRCQ